jgi:dTDP-4-amino-4,6-dideoxygalactose transaminase
MNAKLSEYHAAVGLAALDVWRETRAAWMKVASVYRQALGSSNHIGLQPGFGERWVSSTCIVCVDEARSTGMQQALANAGIETRMWWGRGAHDQPVATDFPRTRLPVTERLARSTFGVPLHQDMDLKEIEHVASALIAAAAA